MKLDVEKYSEHDVESTENVKKTISFGLAANAQEMIFTMFTKNIYSNPIGSVVREITSNCFDAHKEANVDHPVIIRLSKENSQYYINFIDTGVGMSFDRITKIYAEYFNSTKRDDNNQIGGFGIGGKTPLAYGESFFLITNFDGVKYTYCVYKGKKSPDLDPMSDVPTDEPNGTTIKVPIKTHDVATFEYEINRQLYYFENIIFEGFSDGVKNEYTIYSGKHFMYRGENYNNRMHICLGRVAYPIDYFALGLDETEYEVPVALKFDIGEINVTASRETLDYNDDTKKMIKKKIELVRAELKTMLLKQYNNIASLEEYYDVKKSFGKLIINKEKDLSIEIGRVVNSDELVYPKLSLIKIPAVENLSEMLMDIKIMGKKTKKEKAWDECILTMKQWPKIYSIDYETPKNRRIQSWLKLQHDYYYFVTPNADYSVEELKIVEDYILSKVEDRIKLDENQREAVNQIATHVLPIGVTATKAMFKQINLLISEAFDLIQKNSTDYKGIVVPADFVMHRKNELGRALLDRKISIRVVRDEYHKIKRHTIAFGDLHKFKGTIVYGQRFDDDTIKRQIKSFEQFSMIKTDPKFKLFDRDETIKFILITKNLLHLMQFLPNAIPHTDVVKRFFMKKRDSILTVLENQAFCRQYKKINDLFFNKALTSVDKKLKVHTDFLTKIYTKAQKSEYTNFNINLRELKIDVDKITYSCKKQFDYIEAQEKKNSMVKYVNVPRWEDATKNKELMELINLVYVK